MLDFEKELEKFTPSLEVNDAEDSIRNNDMSDIADLIKEIIEENRK